MRYFGPFLILLLLIAMLFRVEFFFTLLYFLAAIAIFARLWMHQAQRQLHALRHFTDRAFPGERLPVQLTVQNKGWLPLLWVELDERLPPALRAAPFPRQVIGLGSHATWETTYTLNCQRRGRYTIGPATVRTGDPLGIVRLELQWPEPREVLVYPRIVPLAALGLPTRAPLAALPTTTPLFEDSSRIVSVHEYRRGDPLRRVHWPATARSGKLVVKQFQPAIARDTLICLDLHESSYPMRFRYDALELAVVAAASLANKAIVQDKLPLGLLTQMKGNSQQGGKEAAATVIALPPRKERDHLIAILEELAVVEMLTAVAEPFTDLLRRDRLPLGWGGTVVIITGNGTLALTDALLALQRSGLACVVILAGQPRPNTDWPVPPGVAVHCIKSTTDLEQR